MRHGGSWTAFVLACVIDLIVAERDHNIIRHMLAILHAFFARLSGRATLAITIEDAEHGIATDGQYHYHLPPGPSLPFPALSPASFFTPRYC